MSEKNLQKFQKIIKQTQMESKQYELQDLSKSNSGEDQDDALYVKAPEMEEFELQEDSNASQGSDTKPNNYYAFLDGPVEANNGDLTEQMETKATRNNGGRLNNFFAFMRDFEIKNNESAGVKFALISTFLLTIVGSCKISLFPHIAFINYLFIQTLVCFVCCYICCRILGIVPFLQNDEHQSNLKASAFYYMVGGLLYLYSWDFWPRQYSHFLLAALPFVILIKESISHRYSLQLKELIFFGFNLVGMFILLAIPDTDEDFSWTGFGISLVAVIFLLVGFLKMKATKGNMISMLTIYLLTMDIFVPAFFAMQIGAKPTIIEAVGMVMIGFLSFVAFVFAVRGTQISKSSHVLLFASLGLAVVNFGRGVKSDGLTLAGIGGTVLSFFGATLILINQSKRTEHMDYDKVVAMIG